MKGKRYTDEQITYALRQAEEGGLHGDGKGQVDGTGAEACGESVRVLSWAVFPYLVKT